MKIVATKKHLTAILSLFTFIVLALFSCTDSNESQEENLSPSIFVINIDAVDSNSVSIRWSTSLDPEGSIVFYDVYLNATKIIENITELSYSFKDLTEGMRYSVEIIASDPEGNTVSMPFII